VSKTILIYCESKEEAGLTALSRELLGCGCRLAKSLNLRVTAVVFGHQVRKCAREALACGADTAILADDELLSAWKPELQVSLLEEICGRADPAVILFGHSDRGRDLAPRLAFRRNTLACMDCVNIRVDEKNSCLEYTRPVYGGGIYAVYCLSTFPQVATLRKGAAEAAAAEITAPEEASIEEIAVTAGSEAPRTVHREREEETGVRLEDAAAVVCGGRGIGSTEDFQKLRDVAGLLKGAVGATRPPCDEGWVPDLLQIGLTGKIVSPNLYIAVALSGASQHITGCSKARTIVAINKDPDAYIFKIAHYGIVGDWRKIIPAFRQRVGELLGE